MSETLEKMYAHTDSLPEELQEIFHRQWDYTGRPIRNMSDTIVELLNKNAATNYAEFEEDYKNLRNLKTLSVSMQIELRTYWVAFLAGAKYISDNLHK